MEAKRIKNKRRMRRKLGLRKRLFGTPDCPRLSVYRSLKHIYAQAIDDSTGRTLLSADSVSVKVDAEKGKRKQSTATAVGKALGQRAKEAGIKRMAMDRNGFKFHGRIKAMAEAARKEGLAI